ncbi:MAG: cell division protein FtsL [Rhizobacter sp.]
MTRFNVLLLLALIVSSLYLVRVSYDARRQFTLLDKAKSEARQLDSDFERLKTEQQSQATPLRVEKTAREKLAMRTASPNVTHYVSGPASAPTSGNTTQEVR